MKHLVLLGDNSQEKSPQIVNYQQNGPAEVQCEFFSPDSGVNFLMWIFGSEFLGGEFLRGPFLLENIGPKNSTPEFDPKIRGSKIRIPEFDPKFGFTRCRIPCAETCWWITTVIVNYYVVVFLIRPGPFGTIGHESFLNSFKNVPISKFISATDHHPP